MSEIVRCEECTDELVLQEVFACVKCENTLCGYCCHFKEEVVNA
jgi:hypothetical protein